MQPKLVPNEQCEQEWFLKTGFSKLIQSNQFENGFSVNTLNDSYVFFVTTCTEYAVVLYICTHIL